MASSPAAATAAAAAKRRRRTTAKAKRPRKRRLRLPPPALSPWLFLLLSLPSMAGADKEATTTAASVLQTPGGPAFTAANSSSSTAPFCDHPTMTMTMYMDGFRSSLFGSGRRGGSNAGCLSYLLPGWKLTDRGKFYGAVLYSVLLGMLLEVSSSIRRRLDAFLKQRRRRRRLAHRFALIVMYAFQAALGYLVMLLAMTYSVEILLAVVSGVMLGNLCFIRYDFLLANTSDNGGDRRGEDDVEGRRRRQRRRRRRGGSASVRQNLQIPLMGDWFFDDYGDDGELDDDSDSDDSEVDALEPGNRPAHHHHDHRHRGLVPQRQGLGRETDNDDLQTPLLDENYTR